jgi:hypothetical protein
VPIRITCEWGTLEVCTWSRKYWDQARPSCNWIIRSLVYLFPILLQLFGFPTFRLWTWWMLTQKRGVRTKSDTYDFMSWCHWCIETDHHHRYRPSDSNENVDIKFSAHVVSRLIRIGYGRSRKAGKPNNFKSFGSLSTDSDLPQNSSIVDTFGVSPHSIKQIFAN